MAKIGYSVEELEVGMSSSIETLVTTELIEQFAEVSGDDNPVHLDAEYAATTMFKERIAHGMLSAGFLSAVLGTKLPGYGAIYLSQTMAFKAPVKIGDKVLATVTVSEVNRERGRVLLACVCSVDGKSVMEGEAKMMVASKNKA